MIPKIEKLSIELELRISDWKNLEIVLDKNVQESFYVTVFSFLFWICKCLNTNAEITIFVELKHSTYALKWQNYSH